jgi:hypothetical protein
MLGNFPNNTLEEPLSGGHCKPGSADSLQLLEGVQDFFPFLNLGFEYLEAVTDRFWVHVIGCGEQDISNTLTEKAND